MDEPSPDDEISLLDLLVVLAESWVLLIVVPILAGIIALMAHSLILSRFYESYAVVRMSAREAEMLQTARVLDRPIKESSWLKEHGNSLSLARGALLRTLNVRRVPDTDFYRVTLSHNSAERAQRLLSLILNELVAQSKPAGSERAMLEERLQVRQEELVRLNAGLERLNLLYDRTEATGHDQATPAEYGQSVVAVVSRIQATREEIITLNHRLSGSFLEDNIIQPPTLSDSVIDRGTLTFVAIAMGVVGFLMLIVAFMRGMLKNASSTADGSAKVARIRRAFWLKNPPTTPRKG